MDFSLALTAAAQALTVVKELRELDKNLSQAELKAKMADLYSSLADMRMALVDANEEIQRKDIEIQSLKDRFQKSTELVEFDGYQYAKNEQGKPTGVPFCPACLASDGTQIRPANLLGEHWQCPKCKALYSSLRKFP